MLSARFAASSRLGAPTNPVLWLGLVAVLYALLQVATTDIGRFLAWDEAIYASEVSGFTDAIYLDAHRARGITFLIAPIAQLTDSVAAIRFYLVVVSSVGLFGAFLPWTRCLGLAGPISAAIFSSSWLAIFYGSEVMPNLVSALLAVAAAGSMLAYLRRGNRISLVLVGVEVAATALIRPVDGAALVAVLVVGTLIMRGRRRVYAAPLVAVVGFGIGMMPWLIEAWVRWGGPFARLRRARDLVGGGLHNRVPEYLRLLDGPLSWPDRSPAISWVGVAWLVALSSMALAGVIGGNAFERRSVSFALIGSSLLAAPYLALSDAAAPRFMLPAIGLLAVAAGAGLCVFLARSRSWVPLAAPAIIIALVVLNLGTLTSLAAEQSIVRDRGLRLVEALRVRVQDTDDCFFLSSSGYPQISFATGCRGGRFSGDIDRDTPLLDDAVSEGRTAYLLLSNLDDIAELGGAAECELIDDLKDWNWHICRYVVRTDPLPTSGYSRPT